MFTEFIQRHGSSLDGTMPTETRVLKQCYNTLLEHWKYQISVSKLNNGIEIYDGLYAITITLANHKRMPSGSRIIQQTNIKIKTFMRQRIEELDKRYNILSIYCYELSPIKMRPHLHGIIKSKTLDEVRDYIIELEQLFGIVKVKVPFYNDTKAIDENGNDMTDWTYYFRKHGNYLNKNYFV